MAEIYLFENLKSGDIPSPAQELASQIAFSIAQDKENKIKEALIDLGWIPPVEIRK